MAVISLARSSDAAPQAWGEITLGDPTPPTSLGTYAQDVAVTHNNNRAAVRYANPLSNETVIGVWQLHATGVPAGTLVSFGGVQNGVAMLSGVRTDLSDSTWGYWPSDRVEVTNVVGASIGAGLMGSSFAPVNAQSDATYIEVFDIGSSPPVFLKQFVVPDPLQPLPQSQAEYDVEHAGNANDVAITRDGAWAVINSDNWIHVVNLANPKGPNGLIGFNIGQFSYTAGPSPVAWSSLPQSNLQIWPCTPNQAVDSIALTNDRAVVTTAREFRGDPNGPGNVFTTWVYIIDFNGPNGPEIVLEHDLAPPDEWTVQGNDDDRPHDVTITPHLEVQQGATPLAVVTTNHTVAVYNLVTDAFLSSSFDGADWRQYQLQVDSVEMTADRAVAISDFIPSVTSTPTWRVKVFALDPTQGFVLLPNGASGVYTGAVGELPQRSHDLALDKGIDKALIRTSFSNVIVPSLVSPPLSPTPPAPHSLTEIPSVNGSNAHAYLDYAGFWGYDVFSSDSVVLGTAQTVNGTTQLMAATIGARQTFPGSGIWNGAVDLLDLAAGTITVSREDILPNQSSHGGCVPVDLAIAFNQDELVVRSVDPLREAAPTTTGPDVVLISFATGLISDSFGGSGTVTGLDSLAVPQSGYVNTSKRILSVSQEELTATGLDFNHIVR